MTKAPADQAAISMRDLLESPVEPVEQNLQPPLASLCRPIRPDARKHRIEREGYEERNQDGNGDGHAELQEEPADEAAHEGGKEDRDDGKGSCQHRKPNFRGASKCGLPAILPHGRVAADVFAHDNGVVD